MFFWGFVFCFWIKFLKYVVSLLVVLLVLSSDFLECVRLMVWMMFVVYFLKFVLFFFGILSMFVMMRFVIGKVKFDIRFVVLLWFIWFNILWIVVVIKGFSCFVFFRVNVLLISMWSCLWFEWFVNSSIFFCKFFRCLYLVDVLGIGMWFLNLVFFRMVFVFWYLVM